MKNLSYFIVSCLFLIVPSEFLRAQCLEFTDGPFPLLQYELYNCTSSRCNAPELIIAPWQPGDSWQLQVPNMVQGVEYSINFGVDPLAIANAELLEITLFDNQPIPNQIASAPGLNLQFTLPGPGTFFMTISEVGSCGLPPILGPFNDFIIDALCPSFMPICNPLTREQAVDALLAPTSGFEMDPLRENLWCPPDDFGFLPPYQGLLPGGTLFGPGPGLIPDFPFLPPPETIQVFTYLFHLDHFPTAKFSHDVDYVTVDALNPSPTIGNGGIRLFSADWWPYIQLPDQPPVEYYNSADLYYTDFEPGAFNPQGLISGTPIAISTDIICPDPRADLPDKNNNKCAIVFAGSQENRIQNSVWKAVERLVNEDCYDKDRIIVVNEGNAATEQALCDSIDAMLALNPKCEEICIHITAHGRETGGFVGLNSFISPAEWAKKMRKVGSLGVPVHITLETCYAGAMGNPYNWGLPKGSSVTFAADERHTSWSYTYTAPDGTKINEDIFSHAINACRNDTTDDDNDGHPDADLDKNGTIDKKEGVAWVIKTRPCYTDEDAIRDYPAGPPPDSTGYDPMPGQVCIGDHAQSISRRYKIPAGRDCQRVCMIFKGDVRNGMALVYDSSGAVLIVGTTLEANLVMIDDVVHTEICFEWAPRFKDCVRYWFHYYTTDGKELEMVKAFVTDCVNSFNKESANTDVVLRRAPATAEDLPTTNVSANLSLDGTQVHVNVFNRSADSGGTDDDVVVTVGYRVANAPIAQAIINDGQSPYKDLPLISVATNTTIESDTNFVFSLDLPGDIYPGQILLVEVDHAWAANTNDTRSIDQFQATGTAICQGDVTYTALSTIPDLTNTDGTIILDAVNVTNHIVAFNAMTAIEIKPNTEVPLGKLVLFLVTGCVDQ